MTTISNEIMPIECSRFYCKLCDYRTCKKSSFNNHNKSVKHKNNELTTSDNQLMPKLCLSTKYLCPNCDKKFNDRSGLWRHNKKCIPISFNTDEKIEQKTDKDDLIMILIKENSEFKTMLMEQQNMMMKVIENGTTNNSNNTTTNNSHNKAFNLQFFLNETCKDAMNIADFVDSIKLQLSDLEKVGELGYVEGISNIIIKNLNDLDETKRPLHCTDKKRETIYIKDQGQWEKEDDNNSKLKKSINKIANQNIKLISQFREKYPECRKSESSISNKYNKMIIEAMGGPGDNTAEKEEKIIRNISKATIISSRNTKLTPLSY
jgi:hypothetical protein